MVLRKKNVNILGVHGKIRPLVECEVHEKSIKRDCLKVGGLDSLPI